MPKSVARFDVRVHLKSKKSEEGSQNIVYYFWPTFTKRQRKGYVKVDGKISVVVRDSPIDKLKGKGSPTKFEPTVTGKKKALSLSLSYFTLAISIGM